MRRDKVGRSIREAQRRKLAALDRLRRRQRAAGRVARRVRSWARLPGELLGADNTRKECEPSRIEDRAAGRRRENQRVWDDQRKTQNQRDGDRPDKSKAGQVADDHRPSVAGGIREDSAKYTE